jgi:hypothetical protein
MFGFLGVKMTCNGEKRKRKRETKRRLGTEGKLYWLLN